MLTEELIHIQMISNLDKTMFSNAQNLFALLRCLEEGKIAHNQSGYKHCLVLGECGLITKVRSKACLPVQIGLKKKNDCLKAIKHVSIF